MARIQILELPMQHVGSLSQTPFVLVFDQVDPARESDSFNATSSEILGQADAIKEAPGARGVLCFSESIEVG